MELVFDTCRRNLKELADTFIWMNSLCWWAFWKTSAINVFFMKGVSFLKRLRHCYKRTVQVYAIVIMRTVQVYAIIIWRRGKFTISYLRRSSAGNISLSILLFLVWRTIECDETCITLVLNECIVKLIRCDFWSAWAILLSRTQTLNLVVVCVALPFNTQTVLTYATQDLVTFLLTLFVYLRKCGTFIKKPENSRPGERYVIFV